MLPYGDESRFQLVEVVAPSSLSRHLRVRVEKTLDRCGVSGEAFSYLRCEFALTRLGDVVHFHLVCRFETRAMQSVREIHTLLSGLQCKTYFTCNHASNYVALRGMLPSAKPAMLAALEEALQGRRALNPEWLRGL